MADDKAPKKGEEYKLPDEEYLDAQYDEDDSDEAPGPDLSEEKPEEAFESSEDSFSEKKSDFSIKELLLNKKVWAPFLIVISVYVVYKFMERRDRPQEPQQAKQEAAKQTPLPKKEKPAVKPKIQPRVAVAPALDNAMKSKVDRAITQNNRNQVRIENLGKQIGGLKANQEQMSKQLMELNESVKALNLKLEERKVVKAPVVKKRPAKKAKPRKKYYKERPAKVTRYYLKAVIPGRAWLKSNKGNLFTVRVGERIAGYGTIEAINASEGVVTTSSGRNITYGKYDS